MLMGLGHGALWVHMNLYYRNLGLGEASIGRILAAGSLGTVLAALPAAVWVDRLSARRVFVVSAIGFALAFAAQLATASVLLLVLASALNRALFTVHLVAAAPFFVRNAKERDRLDLFGFSFAFATLATVISAAGVGALTHLLTHATGSELSGLRLSLLAVAAASLLAVIPFARIQSPPADGPHRGVRDYLRASNWPLLGRLTLPAFLVGCGAGLIIPFLNLYFRDRFGQTPRAIGAYFSVSQAITMIGFLAGPPLARRLGTVRAVVTTELLSIPFFLILAVARDLRLAVLAFWIRAALMNMNHPVSSSFAMSAVTKEDQAVTNSLRMLAWNASWMVSTQFGGMLIERAGYSPPMFIAMGLYAVAAGLFYGFFHGWREEHGPRRRAERSEATPLMDSE
jgi:predicted MFS family arabinose efflux permease